MFRDVFPVCDYWLRNISDTLHSDFVVVYTLVPIYGLDVPLGGIVSYLSTSTRSSESVKLV